MPATCAGDVRYTPPPYHCNCGDANIRRCNTNTDTPCPPPFWPLSTIEEMRTQFPLFDSGGEHYL